MQVRYAILGSVKDADAYQDLAQRACTQASAEEPGTLVYNWFLGDDGVGINEELFESTEAFLTHVGNMTESGLMDEFMQLVDIQAVRVLGPVDDAAREALAGFGAQHYSVVAGLD